MARHRQLVLHTVKVHKGHLGISGEEPFFPRCSGRAGFMLWRGSSKISEKRWQVHWALKDDSELSEGLKERSIPGPC